MGTHPTDGPLRHWGARNNYWEASGRATDLPSLQRQRERERKWGAEKQHDCLRMFGPRWDHKVGVLPVLNSGSPGKGPGARVCTQPSRMVAEKRLEQEGFNVRLLSPSSVAAASYTPRTPPRLTTHRTAKTRHGSTGPARAAQRFRLGEGAALFRGCVLARLLPFVRPLRGGKLPTQHPHPLKRGETPERSALGFGLFYS